VVQAYKTLGGLCYLLGKQSECAAYSSFRKGFGPIFGRVSASREGGVCKGSYTEETLNL